jgi:hypothetical protein
MKYGDPVNGYPRLAEREQTIEYDHSGYLACHTSIVETFEHRARDASDFTLTAIGLPEPLIGPRVVSRWRNVLLILGVLFIGLGALVVARRFFRKRQEK